MRAVSCKAMLATILASLLLVACETNPSRSDDTSQTQMEGAATGAVLGGLLGLALGGNNKGSAVLVGAALGAGAGYLVGNEVAKRKQKYAREEDFLDSEIASAREYNRTASRYNRQLRGDIAHLDQQTRRLEARYRSGKSSKQELARERDTVQKQIASSKKVYDNLEKEYNVKVEVANERRQKKGNDAYVKKLEHEIAALKKNMDDLQSQSVQLAQIDERLTL